MVRNWIILSVSNTVQYVGESVTLINCTVPEPSRKKGTVRSEPASLHLSLRSHIKSSSCPFMRLTLWPPKIESWQ